MTQEEILQANIISLLGLQALPDERKAAMLEQMTRLVQKRLLIRMTDELGDLPETEVQELESLPDEEKINFLAAHIPRFVEIVQEEIMKVKQEMVESLNPPATAGRTGR